jgi:hypothetical protein
MLAAKPHAVVEFHPRIRVITVAYYINILRRLLKFSKAEPVKRCLEETFKKLKDQEQSLINIVTVETYNLVKQIAAGNTITYVKRELPSCVTSLLTTSATGSETPGTNTKVRIRVQCHGYPSKYV